MSVYKRKVRGKRSRNYYIDYTDEEGRKRTVSSGTSDKRFAERVKRKLVDRVRAVRDGLVDPSEERMREEADKPLAQHLKDYLAACRGREEAPDWIREKVRHLDWLREVAGAVPLDGLRAHDVDMRLAELSADGKSARTVNLTLACINGFLNWCVRNGRLRANPLRVLERRNEALDRRRKRRVLTGDETAKLLSVARGQARTIVGARLRPLWYLFPLLAGLRRGDMKRMRWDDLDLKASTPSLTIRGGKARKRVDILPLHEELIRELRAIRPRDALPSAQVFPQTVANFTRRRDFERAGIVLETEEGHADLHALRHTFGTRLAERGVPPAKLQRLMRHATVDLTMKFYVHLGVDSLDSGLKMLPGIEAGGAAAG